MKKTVAIALLFLLASWGAAASGAAFTPETLIYVTEDLRPFNYKENGVLKGLSVDLLRLTWQQMGLKPQNIKMYPWARGYLMLQSQANVVLFTTARTLEREHLFKWAGSITTRGQRCVLVARKDRQIKIKGLEDAKKYRIGTVREDYAEQLILKMGIPRSRIEPVRNMSLNLSKIFAGRLDLIAYTEESFYQILETAGFNRNDFESVYLIKELFPCYAFNRSIPDRFIERFQQALDRVKQGPEYPELLKKYDLFE